MAFKPRQRRKRPMVRKARMAKPSKSLTRAVKQIVKRNVETKTINVPNPAGVANNNNVPYGALSGIQYLVTDVFKMKQGTADDTAIGSPNRIGDRVRGVGFLMDYYFTTASKFSLAGNAYSIPFVKLRISVWRQAFGSPLLTSPLLYDSNFNNTNTSTLQPINWSEGYVKDVLHDKVYIIRANYPGYADQTGQITLPVSNVFHFKKYFKFDKVIDYCDTNTTSPNSTRMPIYITISAEVDDANTGLVPSGTALLYSTGYTRAWFKDG